MSALRLAFTGRTRAALARLLWLAAGACAAAALCLHLADLSRQAVSLATDQAALPEPRPTLPAPPPFEALRYAGHTAFGYTPRTDQPHSFEVVAAPKTSAQAAPEPAPDVSGLRLVATLTATGTARAILEQAGAAGQTIVTLGAPLRDGFVSAIGPAGIELTRGGRSAFLPLWTPWAQASPPPTAMPEGRGMVRRVAVPTAAGAASQTVAVRREGGRRHLGVSVRSLTDDEAKAHGLPAGTGLLVTGVSRAGIDIRENDVLTAMDGRPIASIAMVLDALRAPDKAVLRFTLIRDGRKAETSITLFD